ncbi:hypothetical protein D3C80_1380310 [compost metagenome]
MAVVAFATLTGAAFTLAAEPILSAITPASTKPIILFFIAYYHSPNCILLIMRIIIIVVMIEKSAAFEHGLFGQIAWTNC